MLDNEGPVLGALLGAADAWQRFKLRPQCARGVNAVNELIAVGVAQGRLALEGGFRPIAQAVVVAVAGRRRSVGLGR